jgi:penicillin-binding protein 2
MYAPSAPPCRRSTDRPPPQSRWTWRLAKSSPWSPLRALIPIPFVLGIGQQAFNALNTNPYRPLFNKATNGIYAPASTIKGMVALAALEQGVTRMRTYLVHRLGASWATGSSIAGSGAAMGAMNMHDAIKRSCDTYFL